MHRQSRVGLRFKFCKIRANHCTWRIPQTTPAHQRHADSDKNSKHQFQADFNGDYQIRTMNAGSTQHQELVSEFAMPTSRDSQCGWSMICACLVGFYACSIPTSLHRMFSVHLCIYVNGDSLFAVKLCPHAVPSYRCN